MNTRSIVAPWAKLQQAKNDRHFADRSSGDVYCPMCEEWHENNTLCQMTMEGW